MCAYETSFEILERKERMKHLFSGALLALCMTLASCSAPISGTEPPQLDKPFSAAAEITFGSETCKGQLRRFSGGSWELCVTEPYALEGLIVTIRDGETKLSMYGLEGFADFSDEAVSAAKLIAEALDAAPNGETSQNGKETTVSGDSENARYTLTLDEAGNPLRLTLSGRNISAMLSDFTELPVEEQSEAASENGDMDVIVE